MPTVSVLITTFEGLRFLPGAIASVLSQRDVELECIVVDDASTDGTGAFLEGLDDRRLVVLRNEVNLGPFASANRGLERARGAFMARLDADDVCRPDRLAQQVAFLERHPAVGLVGSECERIDEHGRVMGHQPVPEGDLAIRLRALVASPFIHSTVVWRSSLGLRYDGTLRLAGDYELWTRALEQTRVANLPVPLVQYRVWPQSLSAKQGEQQRELHDEFAARTCARQWPALGIDASTVRQLRAWCALGQPAPMPPAARRLVEALRHAVLGASPSDAALDSFARALFSAPGAYGQPAPAAAPT
ncbi:MAG: glycosyltransferase [Myxococcales bacterium]|nr:glycosyltransferase [Myxococcales bacterium]